MLRRIGLYFILGLGAACAATPTFVQAGSYTTTPSPEGVINGVTTGNTIIVVLTWGSTGTLNSCQDGTNTYTVGPTKADSVQSQSVGICYATNVTGGNLAVTATLSTGGATDIVPLEYSGIAIVGTGDGSASNAASGATGTDGETCGAITTTVSGDLIFSAIVDTGVSFPSNSNNFAAGTGFTRRFQTTNNGISTILEAGEDQIQSSAGSITPTWTATNTDRYACVSQAFKPACGAAQGWPVGSQCRLALTTTGTGKTWTVPSDWSNTNSIEVIGAGVTGANGASSTLGGTGGGGGGYAILSNTTSLTASTSVGYQVGAGGTTGGSTFLCSSGTGGTSPCSLSGTTNGSAVIALGCGAIQGTSGGGSSGACANSGNALGTAAGTTKFAGGNAAAQSSGSGGGGGGAAGLHGAGGAASGTTGGTGDSGNTAAGANGTQWGTGFGSGGGGTGQTSGSGSCTAAVGQYGGGGGGGAKQTGSAGCAGKQGVIIITYTPSAGGTSIKDIIMRGVVPHPRAE